MDPDPNPDPDPHLVQRLDPDPHKTDADPKHCWQVGPEPAGYGSPKLMIICVCFVRRVIATTRRRAGIASRPRAEANSCSPCQGERRYIA
jgi:hypothetical protein